jgi:hypothetical protein
MVNVCDPASFPPRTYFEQHEIPDQIPGGYDYQYIRGLLIAAKGTGSPDLDSLKFELTDELLDGGRYPGVKKVAGKSWETSFPHLFSMAGILGNPFDFQLWFRSRVAFFLKGDFWWFSTAMEPFTMKYVYDGQYFNLLLHFVDGNGVLQSLTREQWAQQHPDTPCKCISVYTLDPCRDSTLPGGAPRVLHGFSLNIEVGALLPNGSIDRSLVLPITFDPDVENKGGNPGP